MRRALHLAGGVLLAVVIAVVALGGAVMVSANTDAGRRLIERSVARFSHGQVLLQGLSGRFPDHLRLGQLTLRDPQGQWLQADALALDWSPLQLLERRAHLQQLTAARVAITRRPAYAPAHRRTRAQFHLPVSIQIDRLEAARVELGAALAGAPVAVRLQGGGRFTSLLRASLQLEAQRLDAVPATYRAQARLSAQQILVQVDLDEGAGGPLANLARLPGLGALAVHLQLSGPRSALATLLDASAGGLRAHASGTVDLPDRTAMLDLSLQSPAMSPRAGLSWRSLSLQARARGSLTAPSTSAQLTLTGLAVSTLQLSSLRADVQGQGRALTLDATLAGLILPRPMSALLRGSPARLQGQVQLARGAPTVVDLTLSHPLIQAQGHYQFGGSASSSSGAGTGTLTASLPRLAPWAALGHLDLQGSGTLQARLDGADSTRQLMLSGALNIRGGKARWASLLGPHAQWSAALAYDDSGITLQRSRLSAAAFTASADGQDRHGVLNVGWRVTVPDLAAVSAGRTSGHLAAQGRVQGTMPRLGLMASADVAFQAHRAPGSIHVQLQARNLPRQPSGRIDISGTLDQAPLQLAASLQPAADGMLALTVQRADWKSLHAEGVLHAVGDLRAPRGDLRAPQGRLSLRMARLADLEALLDQPVQGSVAADINFDRPDGRSRARLRVDAHDIGVPAQQLTTLQVSGDVDQPLLQPQLALRLSAAGSIRGTSATLAMTASGPLSALQLRATATTAAGAGAGTAAAAGGAAGAGAVAGAEPGSGSRVQAQGIWYGAQRQLELTAFNATYRRQKLRLLAPARVSLSGGIAVDRLRVGLGTAVVEAEGSVAPRLDVRASVSNLTAAVFGAVMPQFGWLRAQGHADASLQLQGSLQDPNGSFTLTAGGLGSGNGAAGGLPPGAIKVHAQLAAGAADVQVAVDAGSQMQLRASGRLPLHRTVPMSLKMTGHMNLGLANPVLEAGGQRLLGQLAIEAQVSGTLADPQARGSLTLTQADLQDYSRGVHITDISGRLEADGSQLQLMQFSAHAGSGTISATGSVDLGAAGLPMQLHLTARNAQALKSDLLTADLDMEMRVSGTLAPRHLSAAGTVRVNNATINIPNALPPNVAVLNVVRPGQQAAPPARERTVFADMNVTVNAPAGIFVRGRGLDAHVGGTVHAAGSSSRPNISGGFDLLNGTFDMAGASLTFTSGRLSFNGTGLRRKIDPTLDFTASTYTGGITATLHVGGYADAPVITLSSMPALPQDEILARLLFGESVSQLSALQIAGIGAALVSISGVAGGGGGFNPLTTVQRALGLNRLVVSGGTSGSSSSTNSAGSNQNTGATIEAGRYITNRIYIGAKQSTNGLSQAQVQVDLTRKWKLQTTLSTGGGTVQGATPENDPGSSIGMSYQFDY